MQTILKMQNSSHHVGRLNNVIIKLSNFFYAFALIMRVVHNMHIPFIRKQIYKCRTGQ